MSLRRLNIGYKYKSSRDNVLEEFIIPCLKESYLYDRAVGFFSGNALRLALNGVIEFIKKKDSKIRIITSPYLKKNDILEIKKGLKEEKKLMESEILDEIERIANSPDKPLLASLGWLIARGRLEMRIGDVNTSNHSLFHDKLGIFRDKVGNRVAFFGSLNETYLGYKEHYDAIRVITSWRDPEHKIAEEERDFELLWDDLDPFVRMYGITDAIKKKIVMYAPETKEELVKLIEEYGPPLISRKEKKSHTFNPNNIRPWVPQERALRAVKKGGYKGILKMATGTGKTAVALLILEQFFKDTKRFGNRILILVPSRILGRQWQDFLNENTSVDDLVFRYDSETKVDERRDLARSWKRKFRKNDNYNLFLIITIQSLHKFDLRGKKVDFLIADEVHTYGTENYIDKIEEKLSGTRNIIGLSATPERYYDIRGTERVLDFFGPIVFTYNIKEAQRERKAPGRETVLSKYGYYPFVAQLTPIEERAVKELSKEIGKMTAIGFSGEVTEDQDAVPQAAKAKMNQRARIIKKSRSKLGLLRTILKENASFLSQCIVYCEDRVQLNEIKKVFDSLRIDSYVIYHSQIYRRGEALRLFKEKNCRFILSMHCLDQGVDIPECQSIIFMSSSGNPREYIQRRGRVLRNYEGKPPVKMFDVLVFPKETDSIYRGLVKVRLLRAWEFLDCSQTPEEKTRLDSIRHDYKIWEDELNEAIAEWRG